MASRTSLTPADVAEVYDILLDRAPESEASAEGHLGVHADRKSLFRTFLASPEFSRGLGTTAVVHALQDAFLNPRRVDHAVDDAVLVAMFDRIRQQWAALGESEPHWSVLSSEAYRADNMDPAAMEEFWTSGAREAALIDRFEATTGRRASHGTCLELGCGVGRVTRYLADRFDHVIGVDISPGNLALCREATVEQGNVETVQVRGIEDFEQLPGYDFLFSVIVLQHNPPPVQKAMLRALFAKVRPGGGVLFQIPTDLDGYAFDAETYLSSAPREMEMHGLPRPVVLDEMRRAGLDIVDVVADPFLSAFGSYTFYGVKPV